jgi:hypothetical protein
MVLLPGEELPQQCSLAPTKTVKAGEPENIYSRSVRFGLMGKKVGSGVCVGRKFVCACPLDCWI